MSTGSVVVTLIIMPDVVASFASGFLEPVFGLIPELSPSSCNPLLMFRALAYVPEFTFTVKPDPAASIPL